MYIYMIITSLITIPIAHVCIYIYIYIRVGEKNRFRSIRCPSCSHVIYTPVNMVLVDNDTQGGRSKAVIDLFAAKKDVNVVVTKSPLAALVFLTLTSHNYHRLLVVCDGFADNLDTLGPLLQMHPQLVYIYSYILSSLSLSLSLFPA